jgi:signal transduction histidine kinase
MSQEQPIRVLLVDDDDAVRRAERRALARAGFALDEAACGEGAIAMVRQAREAGRPYALMVVDLQMGGVDGIETTEEVWTFEPDLQVVVCTGSDCQIDELPASDALLIIKKPFQAIELIQAVRALTTKHEMSLRIRAHLLELEGIVEVRTRELTQVNAVLANELVRRDRIETELRLAQRLEAVGHLAAGVAHEINTPIQYVGDNVQFLTEATRDMFGLLDGIRDAVERSAAPELEATVDQLVTAIDLDYLRDEVPRSCESAQHGTARIASIVGALKELSHPGGRDAQAADLNRALERALEVSAGSYRYVADLDKDLGPLPMVVCHLSELGQVFLNLIVNAAHAMETPDRKRGRLGIRSKVEGPDVVISISDTGCGIPDAIRDRIFDPFFTTKEVGRGTGQGLAIARSIVVERHGGSLSLDSIPGAGTTFHIRIPISGPVQHPRVAA